MMSNPLTTFVTLVTKEVANSPDTTGLPSPTSGTSTTKKDDSQGADSRKGKDVPIDPNVCR